MRGSAVALLGMLGDGPLLLRKIYGRPSIFLSGKFVSA
jgi:hypothetical protein